MRQGILVIGAFLALFAVYQNPQEAGGVVRDLLSAAAGLVHSVFDFATALTG
jgi:hypothetical protein